MQDKFNKLFVFLVSQLFLIFFYNISYAAPTDIWFKVPSNGVIAANGTNNYSAPYSSASNNNVLNLNVPPENKAVICCGAGQGEILNGDVFSFYIDNLPSSLLGDVKDNTLNIRCKVDNKCIFLGGMTSTGTVTCNTVNVYDVGSCSEVRVFGGHVFCSGCTENNTLNIYKAFSAKIVCGGIVRTGTSTFNTINIFSNLNILERIYEGKGGKEVEKEEEKNAVIVSGYVGDDGSANSNSVNISGNVYSVRGLEINGGCVGGDGSANSNSVDISGNIHSVQDLKIFGGEVVNGSANSNSVNISGNIHSVQDLKIFGGCTQSNNDGSANSNSVNIFGNIDCEGHINIRGGIVFFINGDDPAVDADAAGNIVSISGKIFSSTGAVRITGGATSNARNNKVIIYETAQISTNCVLYGGINFATSKGFVGKSVGNSLEISFNKSLQVRNINFFQNYKFTLLEGITKGQTILSFEGSNYASFDVDGKDITILLSPKTDLNLGDTVVIHCEKGFSGSASSSTLPGVYNSLVLECRSEFGLALKDNIEARLVSKEVKVRPEAKAYSQGVLGALEFTNQGGDIIAQEAMKEVVDIEKGKLEAFGVVTYGESKYKRGSNVEIKGNGVVAGVGKRVSNKGKEVVYGVYCEYGKGNYKAENKFVSREVEGRGENEYIGVGILGRVELGENEEEERETKGKEKRKGEGAYIEGSVRVGRGKVEYKTSDIEETGEIERQETRYDYNTPYVGGHVCCGYGYKVSEKIKVEGYGRYTCTWQEGKEVMLGRRNEKIKFEGTMSNRIRIGVKGKYEVREKVKPYIGIGGEEELGGAIKAKAEGMEIEEVRLEGMRGIGELGVNMEISERLRMEVRGECFVGKRQGVLAMIKVKYDI